MKLSLTLLANASYCAPERKKDQQLTNDRGHVEPVPCSSAISTNYTIAGGSPFKSVDNGQSGQVTFESYTSNAYCYVDIGSSCDANGVQVEITHMELESYDFYGNSFCLDTIYFSWMNRDGKSVEQTDRQCGCLGENHPSCNEHPFKDDEMTVTNSPIKYNLVGTDAKLVLFSDIIDHGGKIEVDWKCNNPITPTKPVTNTPEMAEALLTGNFTPEKGRDYGCAGRGLFDPFARTIGSHVDNIDAAFFVWKKCVQCASGNDKSNVLAYTYDVDSDTCGDGPSRSYCECDRTLMKVLNDNKLAMGTEYPAERCVPGIANELECCQYNEHFWVHYNQDRSCCGPDGLKEIGSC